MTTATATPAAQLLEKWLRGNGLASQYDDYIDAKIRTGDSFYTRLLAQKGEAAAEEALVRWNDGQRMSDFAAGIEPVAQGMLALASIDTKGEYAKAVDVGENAPFPRCHDIYGPSRMVVVFNQQAPGCGCNQPAGTAAFAPYGQLGLKAVTLQVGNSYEGTRAAQLGLVLPQRALRREDLNEDAYTVATIDLTGFTDCHTYRPRLSKENYLLHALGLTKLDHVVGSFMESGGHFDEAVGFPGATDYLANALPKLGEYFAALAEKLGSDHQH